MRKGGYLIRNNFKFLEVIKLGELAMFYILAVLLVVVLLSVKSTKLFGVILLAVLCMVYPRVFITLILLAVAGYLYLRLGNL